MKTFFYSLLPAVLFFAFIGCSTSEDPGPDVSNKNLDQLLGDAVESLKREKWDDAIIYYNAAYDKNSDDARAIIYSTLANLAKISTDPKVAALIKEHFGFKDYPDKLNALLSDSWMKNTPSLEWDYYDPSSGRWVEWYRKGEYNWCDDKPVNTAGYYYCNYSNWELVRVSTTPKTYNERLPEVKTPSWITGSGSLYDSELINGAFSVNNWTLSILANVLDKNSNGFNGLLDDVIDGVFGASYSEAVKRLKKLESKPETRINLDPYFIETLGLEELFDGHDQIGWAEVNAVLSAMLAVKASLEWVQTYDLSTDLNWLKFAWSADEDKFEQELLNKFNALSASKLPFNNNFLKARSGKTMATPKATYTAAIRGLQASYASIQNSELYPREVKNAYPAINDGFNKLVAAINDGGKFYIPEGDLTKTSTWPTTGNYIDLGKLFEPGYFSLDKIFKTSDGKPVFYLRTYVEKPYEYCYDDYDYVCGYDDDGDWGCQRIYLGKQCYDDYEYRPVYTELTQSNYTAKISEGGKLSLAINTGKITALVDKIPEDEFEYVELGLSQEHAKAVFEKYYK